MARVVVAVVVIFLVPSTFAAATKANKVGLSIATEELTRGEGTNLAMASVKNLAISSTLTASRPDDSAAQISSELQSQQASVSSKSFMRREAHALSGRRRKSSSKPKKKTEKPKKTTTTKPKKKKKKKKEKTCEQVRACEKTEEVDYCNCLCPGEETPEFCHAAPWNETDIVPDECALCPWIDNSDAAPLQSEVPIGALEGSTPGCKGCVSCGAEVLLTQGFKRTVCSATPSKPNMGFAPIIVVDGSKGGGAQFGINIYQQGNIAKSFKASQHSRCFAETGKRVLKGTKGIVICTDITCQSPECLIKYSITYNEVDVAAQEKSDQQAMMVMAGVAFVGFVGACVWFTQRKAAGGKGAGKGPDCDQDDGDDSAWDGAKDELKSGAKDFAMEATREARERAKEEAKSQMFGALGL